MAVQCIGTTQRHCVNGRRSRSGAGDPGGRWRRATWCPVSRLLKSQPLLRGHARGSATACHGPRRQSPGRLPAGRRASSSSRDTGAADGSANNATRIGAGGAGSAGVVRGNMTFWSAMQGNDVRIGACHCSSRCAQEDIVAAVPAATWHYAGRQALGGGVAPRNIA